jgi:hypothetical protein
MEPMMSSRRSIKSKTKSLTSVMTNYGVQRGIKLSAKNIGVSGNVELFPLYMAMFL